MSAHNSPRKIHDPFWLNPNDPRYWEHQKQKIAAARERLEQESKPKTVIIELSWEEHAIVEEALGRASKFLGTNDTGRAFTHISEDYLSHGPHVRHFESMAKKHRDQSKDEDGDKPE